jgi:predicted small secreted protein
MKKEVAERKGFIDMDNIDFELVIDEKTGQEIVQIKNNTDKLTKGNVSFDLIIDPTTGQQTLRMKQEVEVKCKTNEKFFFSFIFNSFHFFNLVEKIENDLITDDFEEIIDQITGERTLKLTAEAAAKKGLHDLRDIAFEIYVDPISGKEQIRMKGGNQTGQLNGDQKFEIYVDQKTGQQKIVINRPKERTRRRKFFVFVFIDFLL